MYETKQGYSYTQALDFAVKQQLQAEIATSSFPVAAACNLPFCLLDILELTRLSFKPGKHSEYQEMKSIVWN